MEQSELLTNLGAVPWAINTIFHYTIYVLFLQSIITLGCTIYFATIGGGWGCWACLWRAQWPPSLSWDSALPARQLPHAADKTLYKHVLDKSNNMDVIMQERLEEFELEQINQVRRPRSAYTLPTFTATSPPRSHDLPDHLSHRHHHGDAPLKWRREYDPNEITIGKVVALISVVTLLGRCYDRIREAIGPLNALGTLYHEDIA